MSSITQRDHKILRGRILYTSDKPERKGRERGRESFTVVLHNDGRRSLQAHAEIDDRPSVLRFTQVNMNPQWQPTDAAVRITVGDQFRGSAWFQFGEREAVCEGFTSVEGRISQRIALNDATPMFGSHAIANDAWTTKVFDLNGPKTQTSPPFFLSSPDHRGATGPVLSQISVTMTLEGREKVTVKAGTFDALHFSIGAVHGMPEEHPLYHMWVSADGNYTFLKGAVGGYMMTAYELVELSDRF